MDHDKSLERELERLVPALPDCPREVDDALHAVHAELDTLCEQMWMMGCGIKCVNTLG